MYNGIGLETARGTGTNGYVQSNLSSLQNAYRKIEYNGEADLKRMEAEVNRPPNEDLLNHQRKRQVEIKCVEFEMLMEEKGFDDDEIQKKVNDYRKLLLDQLASGELNLDDELDLSNTHARRTFAAKNRDRMRDALGLKKDYVPGSSMASMNKTDVVDAALEACPGKPEGPEAALDKMKDSKRNDKDNKSSSKKRKRKDSSSSSSSSSGSSDSDSDSESSSTSSSDEESKRRRHKKDRTGRQKQFKSPKKEEPSPRRRRESPPRRGRESHRY